MVWNLRIRDRRGDGRRDVEGSGWGDLRRASDDEGCDTEAEARVAAARIIMARVVEVK